MAANENFFTRKRVPKGIIIMGRVDPLSSEECYINTTDTATRVGFKDSCG